jgi:hypothetical protein
MAFAARNRGIEGDAITDPKFGDVSADRFDNPCGFVSHDQGRNAAAGATVESMDVAAADPAGSHGNQ